MGFISNQWLNKGQGLRNRRYSPVPVRVRAENPTDSWSRQNDVVVEITTKRTNSEYQTLHLTPSEANNVAGIILSACSDEVRMRLARQLLKGMTDAELLRILAADLKIRIQKTIV